MATFGQLQERVLRLLDEVAGTTTYPDELVLDAIQAAFDEILPWIPKKAIASLSTSGATQSLPVDFYAAEAVLDDNGDTLPRVRLLEGEYFGSSMETNGWLLFPSGSITFSETPSAAYTLYYLAHWTKPDTSTNDDDELEIPDYAVVPVSFYAAAYCVIPDAVSITEVTQWKTRVDSGNPEHNPRQQSIMFLMKLFKDSLQRVPKYARVGE